MIRRIHILYEDRLTRGTKPTQYAPHELLVSCVSDSLAMLTREQIRDRLVAVPKGGDSKLLAACVKDIGRLGSQGQPVAALFDDDKVRELLKLPKPTAKRDVARAIAELSSSPKQLVVWILDKNLESVVDAAATCLGKPSPPKTHEARDKLLHAVAWGLPSPRHTLRASVPSFDCFVAGVARLMAC